MTMLNKRLYRLSTGSSPFEIIRQKTEETVLVKYVRSGIESVVPVHRLVSLDDERDDLVYSYENFHQNYKRTKRNEEMHGKLYKVKGEDVYGTRLTTDSSGNIVLELKGGGGVKAYAAKLIEEVLPYTVDVTFLEGGGRSAYSYFSTDGDVAVDDLLYMPGTSGLAMVVATNTKSRKANKWLEGWKLSGTKLIGRVDDDA